MMPEGVCSLSHAHAKIFLIPPFINNVIDNLNLSHIALALALDIFTSSGEID